MPGGARRAASGGGAFRGDRNGGDGGRGSAADHGILPSIAQDWIKAFDYGMPVAPFEFELLLPPELEEKLQKPRVERTRRVEPEPFFAPPRKNLVPAAEAKDEDELVLA